MTNTAKKLQTPEVSNFDSAYLENHWMPFTDNKSFKKNPRIVTKGSGVHIWSHKGHKVIDGSAGLFAVAAGHCRPEIAAAVSEQLLELDYTAPFLRSHPKAFELANRIAGLTPDPINHVFFVNSGSESVDTAMKIALAYHVTRNEAQRNVFVSRDRAYHGVNIGGTSLAGMVKNREAFDSVLPSVVHMRATWRPEQRFVKGQPPESGEELANDLLRAVQTHGASRIAACFVEPIAGSTGVLVPPVGYLERLREICDEFGILLVFDEVITGFGRTGKPFASQSFGVTPDIITMAKAITNGAQPMGAVAVKDKIYDTIVDAAPENAVELFHGYTFSGHPAACAASLAVLDIYENEALFARSAELSPYFLEAIFSLQDVPAISDIRGYGMLAGIDLDSAGQPPGVRGNEAQKKLFDAGLHIKTTGDAGVIAPPFTINKNEIDQMCGILRSVLSEF